MHKPPFQISDEILNLSMAIASLIGALEGLHFTQPSLQLRKENQIKTIQSSLAIEGNTLSLEQVTAIIDNKKVIGPAKDILEVNNAFNVYKKLKLWNYSSQKDFQSAHGIMMKGLIDDTGGWRKGNVGVFAGKKVTHIAPKPMQVPRLMNDLFQFLAQDKNTIALIKSCVFHYELEFIHPFADGNGRMGRLWQQLILMDYHPLFEYLPIESLIKKHQKKYYASLATSDQSGDSTAFIAFMLGIILEALREYEKTNIPITPDYRMRLESARVNFKRNYFSRKEYLMIIKNISSATASRDLNEGVKNSLLVRKGDKRLAKYKFI